MQLNREDLLKAYRTMRTIREFEERVHDEFSAGNIPGFVHLYAGEEASGVGVCMHLTDRDPIASTHRGHGHCIAKGCDVEGMMEEIFGRKDGLCGGKGGSMHIADLSKGMMGANGIVGGGPPLICGAALTAKTLKTGGVAIAFVGDGASNQGTTLEATTSPRSGTCRRSSSSRTTATPSPRPATGRSAAARSSARQASACRPSEVDGHDFFAVYEVAARGDRAGAGRRRPEPAPRQAQPLLRAFRRRRDDLSRPGRGCQGARRAGSARDLPPARGRGRPARGRRNSTRSTAEIESRIDQVGVEAKAAPMPTRSDLLTDVYVSY